MFHVAYTYIKALIYKLKAFVLVLLKSKPLFTAQLATGSLIVIPTITIPSAPPATAGQPSIAAAASAVLKAYPMRHSLSLVDPKHT